MPYIKRGYRGQLDYTIQEFLDNLWENIHALDIEDRDSATIDGIVNYTLTKILGYFYNRPNYQTLSRAIMTLEAVKLEWYRRLLAPYEDKRKEDEGDVFE